MMTRRRWATWQRYVCTCSARDKNCPLRDVRNTNSGDDWQPQWWGNPGDFLPSTKVIRALLNSKTGKCFYRAAGRSSEEKAVCRSVSLSVRPSVQRVHCDKTEERSSQIFTALHIMQTRYSDENSVCLSVCPFVRPSVCHTRDPWQNKRKIGPDFYTIRKYIYPSFLRRRMVGGGRPLLP